MKPAEQLAVDIEDAMRKRDAAVAPHYKAYQEAIAPTLQQFEVDIVAANARFNTSFRGV